MYVNGSGKAWLEKYQVSNTYYYTKTSHARQTFAVRCDEYSALAPVPVETHGSIEVL